MMPLFAFLMPAMLLMCSVAINVSYFRLLKTEIKIATDSTAHAAGRAMSIYQDADQAIAFAVQNAGMNSIGNRTFAITADDVEFGRSRRLNNGYGRYDFTAVALDDVRSQLIRPNSIAVDGFQNFPLLLLQPIGNYSSINVAERSIATQVDRDIALVLDRSGSMLSFKDEEALNDKLYDLRRRGRISSSEYSNAVDHDTFSSNVVNRLTGEMKEYASDMRNNAGEVPRHCRWALLDDGVTAFLDVLDATDQEELVTLATFATSASLDYNLSLDYSPIRTDVTATYPNGWTAIGQGIQTSVPEIMNGSLARPFAAKTIVILTDGINNRNPNPVTVVQELVAQYNVTIHTVTFSADADQASMQTIATLGGGKHYHSDDGNELVEIFEEIANNLPTILTH